MCELVIECIWLPVRASASSESNVVIDVCSLTCSTHGMSLHTNTWATQAINYLVSHAASRKYLTHSHFYRMEAAYLAAVNCSQALLSPPLLNGYRVAPKPTELHFLRSKEATRRLDLVALHATINGWHYRIDSIDLFIINLWVRTECVSHRHKLVAG